MESPLSDPTPGSTPRTQVRRLPDKATDDRQTLYDVLDAGLVCHVGLVDDGQPFVLPCAYARDDDRLLLHGSTGSRLFRLAAGGADLCVTVTLLDGLVYARSLFESSMRYRSAMVLGRGSAVGADDLTDAMRVLSQHLLPGRWDDARQPNRKELAATLVVSLPLAETSVKVSAGWPDDEPADLDLPVWAGVVPLRMVADIALDAPDLSPGIDRPDYLPGPPAG